MASLFNLSGKVALITGASAGIGASTAILFSRLGARLSLVGRNETNLLNVKAECAKQQGASEPFVIIADVSKEVDVKRIIDSTIEKFGKLDILVNNAGIIEFGSIENTSLEQYDRVMNINVRCVYHLTMLAVPHLIKTTGNIVNVSSVCGTRSFPNVLSYCMSKSAIDQFTSCTALELASKCVRVNSVNPGVIVTDLQKRGGLTEEAYAAFLERTKESHPLGRPGQPRKRSPTRSLSSLQTLHRTSLENTCMWTEEGTLHALVDGGHRECYRDPTD